MSIHHNLSFLFLLSLIFCFVIIIIVDFASSSSSSALELEVPTCRLVFHNTLQRDFIRLCGRKNGGVPGAWYSKLLKPNETFVRPCSVTTDGISYETYFTIRNSSTNCGWNNPCNPNTGTCLEYPWTIGEGLSSQDQYWYGSAAQNWDGDIGFTKYSYFSPQVSYGIRMDCMSYGVTPWNATCVPSASGAFGAVCSPSQPVLNKFADTGVVACGKASTGTIYITIIEA